MEATKQQLTNILLLLLVPWCVILSIFFCSSCNRDLEVYKEYPFDISVMPYLKKSEVSSTTEFRMNLVEEGSTEDTQYTLRYFPYEGSGRLLFRGEELQPNDRYVITPGAFKLYYQTATKGAHKLEIVVENNLGMSRTLVIELEAQTEEKTQA